MGNLRLFAENKQTNTAKILKKLWVYGNIFRYMNKFMNEALKEAEKASKRGEVPVGAVIELNGEIIGKGSNRIREKKDPTAHAEIEAIKEATRTYGRERIPGASMYVTLEPCTMCIGAIILCRLENLYVGVEDIKSGACGSIFNIPQNKKLNHNINVEIGIMKEESKKILQDFFKQMRESKKAKRKLGGK